MSNNRRHNSNRLQGYDYSQEGAYFVTICTHHRECLFGNVVNEEMILSDIGKILQTEWAKSAEIRSEIEIGEFVIMPNHMHGIVWIVNPSDEIRGGNDFDFNSDVGAYGDNTGEYHTPLRQLGIQKNDEFRSPSKTLGAMIRGFKSASTKQINQIRNTPRVPVFQRGFHDHIIRDEPDYQRIYNYILTNPIKWKNDKYYGV